MKLTLDKLDDFCRRYGLDAFMYDGKCYTTDRQILLCIEGIECPDISYLDCPVQVNTRNKIPLIIARAFADPEGKPWFMPEMPGEETRETCKDCLGSGKQIICPECTGDGEVQFDNNFSDYEITCKTCDGAGRLAWTKTEKLPPVTCSSCRGSGIEWNDKPIAAGGGLFKPRVLAALSELDNCQIRRVRANDPAAFQADGVTGCVMESRENEERHRL